MEPRFQLTYLTFTDKEKWLGHSCVGVTKIGEDGSRELLFRVGLFPTNQVEIEDFIKNKPGRNFKERSFDINQEQLIKLLSRINTDRRTQTPDNVKKPRNPESKIPLASGEYSVPKGPEYSKYNHNCKDYALSLIRSAGIDTASLENMGTSIPIW